MTIKELAQKLDATIETGSEGLEREIQCGYCCDLLSWVMAHSQDGMAWSTVQTHMNVVAVAVLGDMACVIAPEGAVFPQEVVKKAQEEGLHLLCCQKSAYEIAGIMAQAGIA